MPLSKELKTLIAKRAKDDPSTFPLSSKECLKYDVHQSKVVKDGNSKVCAYCGEASEGTVKES